MTRSRSCAIGNGFTLAELLAALAIMALLASVVAVGLGRTTPQRVERAALQRVTNHLAALRVAAMRSGAERSTIFGIDGDQIELRSAERTAVLDAHGLRLVDVHGGPLGERAVRFSPSGRTVERVWRIVSPRVDARRLARAGRLGADPAVVPSSGEGRVWRIVFDPLSGTPGIIEEDRT